MLIKAMNSFRTEWHWPANNRCEGFHLFLGVESLRKSHPVIANVVKPAGGEVNPPAKGQ